MLRALLDLYQRHATRRMFSRWSSIYEEEVADNAYAAADEVAKAVLRHAGGRAWSNPQIADIGIGTGLLAQQVYDALPCRIAGLDFSEDMMASCAGRGITDLLIKCDAGRDPWPLAQDAYGAVMSAGLIEYFTPGMLQHFLQQSAIVTQQNGLLVFTYVPDDARNSLSWWHGHSGSYLTSRYTSAFIEETVKANGFRLLEHSPPFAGCVFGDGSSYNYRLIAAEKTTARSTTHPSS